MIFLDAVRPTATESTPIEIVQWTTTRIQREKPRQPSGKRAMSNGHARLQTALDIDPADRGDENERNQAEAFESDRGGDLVTKNGKEVVDSEGPRIRSELARDLVQRVNQLIPQVGDVALATNIGLLKRDLSRCHNALKVHPVESNFLSIVTLVESAMTQLKWKQYDRSQLEVIRQAFDIGYQQVKVGVQDYEKARSLLSRGKVDATPRIDLASLELEDLTDEQE